jgi:hypothetical protein
MSDFYCLGCLKIIEEGDLIEYREDDVNWSELRCPCGSSELEEVNREWALSTVRWALAHFSRYPERLKHALDFFEGESP